MAARGHILRNLDSDDWLVSPGALRLVAEVLSGDAALTTNATLVHYGDGDARNQVSAPEHTGLLPRRYVGDRWATIGGLGINVMTLGIRADLFWRCGGYRAMTYAEDIALVIAANDLEPIWIEEEVLSVYRQWPGQITRTIERGWELRRTHELIVRSTGRDYVPDLRL